MKSTTDLLRGADIRTALVVDDGFDPVPTSADLSSADDAWAIFFADLDHSDQEQLQNLYEGFEGKDDSELRTDDVFVSSLWNHRSDLRGELVNPLFEMYIADTESDSDYLSVLCSSLEAFGLLVKRAGRDFLDDAEDSDLIVVDLFLGSAQSKTDMVVSIAGLASILTARADCPPAIILMSRSTRLGINADDFRDQAGAFASGFRQIAKSKLKNSARLEQILRELARHRADSLKLTAFLRTWRKGLGTAVDRTATEIRRLDLHDWAQIRDLLLSAEGVSAGSYILDIFDRVLLHEVESDKDTIAAALALNTLNEEIYPPMTAAGSKDTLTLLSKTLYQHQSRRALDSPEACPVAFGDIIGTESQGKVLEESIFEGDPNLVFVVMTPACDLQRRKARRALLMAGSCKPIDAAGISYGSSKSKTAILTMPSAKRVGVEWDRSHIAAMTLEDLEALLGDDGAGVVVGRLRDESAIALQQELLSGLGRVGQIAEIPLTQQVEVRVFYPNTESELVPLQIGDRNTVQAVCFVGREKDEKIVRIPFDPEQRFQLFDALKSIEIDSIHERSRDKIGKCTDPTAIDFLLSQGITVDVSSSRARDWKAPVSGEETILGRAVFGGSATDSIDKVGAIRTAGLVLEIMPQQDASIGE